MEYLNFTDRTTYLAQRAEWRADYQVLSREIREQKHFIANAQRSGDYDTAANSQWQREINRRSARKMMAIRKEMKEKSAAQRLARLEEQATA